jgi:hypothetical protein
LKKHFFGEGPTALRQIDPGGTPDQWIALLGDLAGRDSTAKSKDGKIDIIGTFPRTDESGTFELGIHLNARPDVTFDLVTVLTKQ